MSLFLAIARIALCKRNHLFPVMTHSICLYMGCMWDNGSHRYSGPVHGTRVGPRWVFWDHCFGGKYMIGLDVVHKKAGRRMPTVRHVK